MQQAICVWRGGRAACVLAPPGAVPPAGAAAAATCTPPATALASTWPGRSAPPRTARRRDMRGGHQDRKHLLKSIVTLLAMLHTRNSRGALRSARIFSPKALGNGNRRQIYERRWVGIRF